MATAEARIVDGVRSRAEGWVVEAVARVVDAWGRLDEGARAEVLRFASEAGRRAGARVVDELRTLFATDPSLQRATPLQVVRTLRREPTELLARAGVPPVERDRFEERAFPDDVYGIVPRSLADLGDPDLGPLLLAWGTGKATVLRARAARGRG